MKPALLAIVLTLAAACGDKLSSNVKISNVTQGMARQSNGTWTIYEKGDHLTHRVNGDCVVAGEAKPCMWIAVAFEYEADGDRTILTCKAKFSEPADVVNPREVSATKVTEDSGTLELRGRRGKMVLPGYVIADGNPNPQTTTTDCVLLGKSVLNYSMTVTERR